MVAPAGSGKTTVLARWATDYHEPVAWLSLSPQDNTLHLFVVYLIAAVSSVEPDFAERVHARVAQSDEPEGQALRTAALNEIARATTTWALVLDDYHTLTEPSIHDFVVELIAVLPEGCRLIVSSRDEPPFAIARLLLSGDLLLLGHSDLAATPDECQELFTLYGIALSDEQVATLIESTAGWLVALRCVALAAQTMPIEQVLESMPAFGARQDLLSEYLLQEVLEHEPAELREFILRIALLDRFTADVCYAVTGNPQAGQLLEQVRRRQLFLVRLDTDGTWFRFHHLFTEFLIRQLTRTASPPTIRALNSAASHWFAQHNFTDEAIVYAMRAEDWPHAAALITTISTKLFLRYQLNVLTDWVQSFPREVLLADPNLCAIAAFALVRQGRGAEADQYISAAETHWSAQGHQLGLAEVALVQGADMRFRADSRLLIEHTVRGILLATGESPLTPAGDLAEFTPRFITFRNTWMEPHPNVILYIQFVLGLLYAGRLADADLVAERLNKLYVDAGIELTSTYSAPLFALLRIAHGQLDGAAAILRQMNDSARGDVETERVLLMATLAEVLYEQDRLDDAADTIRRALRLQQRIGSVACTPIARLQLARIRYAQGDVAGAASELDLAATAAEVIRSLHWLRAAEVLQIEQALREGDLPRARAWMLHRVLGDPTDLTNSNLSELLLYARVLIATDETERAVALLEQARPTLEAQGRRHDLLKLLVVLSLAELDLFELDRAVDVLAAALDIGEAGGYSRVFIDEGEPMYRLLRVAHRRGVGVLFIRQLLETTGQSLGEVNRIVHQELAEPITAREIEVLRFIALGMTNHEISEELFLSVGTVKRHITNLYGKLGVASRTDAVQRGRKLGLLSLNTAPTPARRNVPQADEH